MKRVEIEKIREECRGHWWEYWWRDGIFCYWDGFTVRCVSEAGAPPRGDRPPQAVEAGAKAPASE